MKHFFFLESRALVQGEVRAEAGHQTHCHSAVCDPRWHYFVTGITVTLALLWHWHHCDALPLENNRQSL